MPTRTPSMTESCHRVANRVSRGFNERRLIHTKLLHLPSLVALCRDGGCRIGDGLLRELLLHFTTAYPNRFRSTHHVLCVSGTILSRRCPGIRRSLPGACAGIDLLCPSTLGRRKPLR